MAENEVLDIAGARRYSRYRAVAADASQSPFVVAEVLCGNFISSTLATIRAALRKGVPLQLLLDAAGNNQSALAAVIQQFPDRALFGIAQLALKIVGPKDVRKLAEKAAELVIDGVRDKACRHLLGQPHNAEPERRLAVERGIDSGLNECRAPLVDALEASMRGQQFSTRHRLAKRVIVPKTEVKVLAARSLRPNLKGAQHAPI